MFYIFNHLKKHKRKSGIHSDRQWEVAASFNSSNETSWNSPEIRLRKQKFRGFCLRWLESYAEGDFHVEFSLMAQTPTLTPTATRCYDFYRLFKGRDIGGSVAGFDPSA